MSTSPKLANDQYAELSPDLIYWKDPIRKDIPEEDIKNLATSFIMHGQIEPIVVEGPDQDGKYEGICGQMRYEAMKRFQGKPILARVHKFTHPREKREWQLAENLHRRDLTAMQKAEAYKELYNSMRAEHGGEVKDQNIVFTIAERQEKLTGEKAPAEKTIYRYMELADLPSDVKAKVAPVRNFGLRHGIELLRLKDKPDKQLELVEKFIASTKTEESMTVQQLKKEVDEILTPPEIKIVRRKFDVWSIAGQDVEKPFGDQNYPGAIPGDIIGNVLLWFLPDGGKIVDPMAGGGVTEDVCNFLGADKYQCVLFDSKRLPNYKYRESIHFNDIGTGSLPQEAENANLVFADPPYGPLKEYGMNIEDLKRILTGLAQASYKVLKLKGKVAVLMQNYYEDGECTGNFIGLVRQTVEVFEKAGFTQIFEVTVPLYGKVPRSEANMTHIDRRPRRMDRLPPSGEPYYPFKLGYRFKKWDEYASIHDVYRLVDWQLTFEKKTHFLNQDGQLCDIKDNSHWERDHFEPLKEILDGAKSSEYWINVQSLLDP